MLRLGGLNRRGLPLPQDKAILWWETSTSTVARTYDTNVVAATEHLKTAVSTVRQNRTGVYEVDHMESTACLDQNCQLVPGASLCEL